MFLEELGPARESPELEEVEALLELFLEVRVHLDGHKDANGIHSRWISSSPMRLERVALGSPASSALASQSSLATVLRFRRKQCTPTVATTTFCSAVTWPIGN